MCTKLGDHNSGGTELGDHNSGFTEQGSRNTSGYGTDSRSLQVNPTIQILEVREIKILRLVDEG